MKKVENHTKIIDLSRGIVPIAGSCAHGHKHDKADGDLHPHGADLPGNSGLQGVDPHVWTSPKALQRMAANAYDAIRTRWPDSAKYEANYRRLQRELQALDIRTGARIDSSGVKSFIVYHPALTYYARDYGLEQIAIEADGKEPSARRLAHIIRRARKEKIRKILYQSQFPASAVEIIAGDIDGKGIPFDPLREDPIAGIDEITRIITEQ